MRNKFDEQLEKLNADMTQMGATCESAIACAVKALLTNDRVLAQDAIKRRTRPPHGNRDRDHVPAASASAAGGG